MVIAARTGNEADIDSADGASATAWQLVVTMPRGSYSLGETAAKQKMEVKVVSLGSTRVTRVDPTLEVAVERS